MKLSSHIAVVGVALWIGTSASAVTLSPGAVVFTNGTTSAAQPELGGVVQNDNLIDFAIDPSPATPATNVGGKVQNRVADNGTNLIFAPRIRDTFNIDGGTFSILAFRLDGYAGFDVDVDYRLDGLGDKGFSSVSRSVSGDIMTFRYDDPIYIDAINPPGRQETSYFPSILTDAQDYELTGTMTIFGEILPLGGASTPGGSLDNFFSVTIGGIAVPTVAAVPLPAGGALLIAAIGGLGLVRRRQLHRT